MECCNVLAHISHPFSLAISQLLFFNPRDAECSSLHLRGFTPRKQCVLVTICGLLSVYFSPTSKACHSISLVYYCQRDTSRTPSGVPLLLRRWRWGLREMERRSGERERKQSKGGQGKEKTGGKTDWVVSFILTAMWVSQSGQEGILYNLLL